jgi:NAD(P)-dependent dehydrogenase (short-subunit alcohol dehydrogenase family)
MNTSSIINGKRILITGATAGLGAHLAIEIAKNGGFPIVLGRDEQKSSGLIESFINLKLSPPEYKLFDITDSDKLAEFVDQLIEIDGLVLCAGVNDKTTVKFISSKKIEKMFSVNFTANAQLIQSLIKKKKLKKGASIVGVSSLSAGYVSTTNSLYSASKAAFEMFLKTLALEHAPDLRVNVIRPGLLNSKMSAAYDFAESMDEFSEKIPLKRMGEYTDISPITIMLLSDQTSWMTGAVIPIDGGMSI